MGAVLPLSNSLGENLISVGVFVLFLLVIGSLWGLAYSLVVAMRNWNKFSREFMKQARERKISFILAIVLAVVFIVIILYIGEMFLLVLPVLIILLPLLYSYGKAVENSCLILLIKTNQLTVGDWLVDRVRVGRKVIMPDWEGVSERELKILKNYRGKVRVKYGIPFVPAFLISFLAWIVFNSLTWTNCYMSGCAGVSFSEWIKCNLFAFCD
jgi:hypothetical protein